jgi:hypothetical protein
MKHIVIALVAVLWLAAPAHAQENPQIGTIAEVEGAVTLTHGASTTIAAQVNDPVFLDDRIGTGAKSRAHVLFIDDTEVTLGENAAFSAEEDAFDESDPSAGKAKYSALRGSFIYVGGLIDKNPKPDVRIDTAYGTIGMRGTVVWGGYMDDAYGVFTADGSVSVKTDGGEVIVNKGEGTDVRGRGANPDAPKIWKDAKVGRAKKMIALKNLKAVQARVAKLKEKQEPLRARLAASLRARAKDGQRLNPQQKQQLQQRIQHEEQRLQQQNEHSEQIRQQRQDRLEKLELLQEQRRNGGNLQQNLRLQQQQKLHPDRAR